MGYKRTLSATHRQRISQGRKGKKHSQATKDKISKKIKALWACAEKENTSTSEVLNEQNNKIYN